MEFLILLGLPAVLVWGLVLLNYHRHSNIHLLPAISLGVLLTGSVLGYEFFHLSGGPVPLTIDRVLLVGLLGLCVLFYFRESEDLRPLNRADLLMLTLVGFNTWSMLTHDWRFLDNMPASRLLFFYCIPVALYFVIRTVRLETGDLKWFAYAFAGFGVYLALTAVAETREMATFVFPRYILTSSDMEFLGRGRGPFLNPVANGIFMVVGCFCLWMTWPQSSRRWKLILVAITAVFAAGIFCTLTRSIWLGFVASAAVIVWFSVSRSNKGLLIIAGTLAAVLLFPVVGERIFSFKRDKQVSVADMENSATLRPLFAVVALNMFQDRPIFGCGFGQYAREKYPYLQDPYSGKPLAATKIFMQHNIILAYVTEMGLVGLFVLLATLLMMAASGWSLWRDPEADLWSRMFGLLLVVTLANYLVNGMFHDISIIPMQNMLLFFLFGIVNNIQTSPESFESARQHSVAGRRWPYPPRLLAENRTLARGG